MMKVTFISLALIFLTALAHGEPPAGYTKVPSSQIETYQKAIRSAINQKPGTVRNCNLNWINHVLQYPDEILVQSQSSQPLLMVDAFDETTGEQVMNRMMIFTEPDLKTINKVVAEVYKMGEVNKGDLAHPVIVQDYILQNSVQCTIQNSN